MNFNEAKDSFNLLIQDVIKNKISIDDAKEELEFEFKGVIDEDLYENFLNDLEDLEEELENMDDPYDQKDWGWEE